MPRRPFRPPFLASPLRTFPPPFPRAHVFCPTVTPPQFSTFNYDCTTSPSVNDLPCPAEDTPLVTLLSPSEYHLA